MSDEIRQGLDQYSDQSISRDLERILDQKGYEQFLEDVGNEYLNTRANASLIVSWLNDHGVPCSRRNCMVAYQELIEQGIFETNSAPEITYTKVPLTPEDRGVQKIHSGVVLRYDRGGMAESQLTRERPERLQELLGDTIDARQEEDTQNYRLVPLPKTPRVQGDQLPLNQLKKSRQIDLTALKEKYRASLNSNRRQPTNMGLARATVSEWIEANGLDIAPNSLEFNKLVAECIQRSKQ